MGFEIFLPLATGPEDELVAAVDDIQHHIGTEHILFVDDEKSNRITTANSDAIDSSLVQSGIV